MGPTDGVPEGGEGGLNRLAAAQRPRQWLRHERPDQHVQRVDSVGFESGQDVAELLQYLHKEDREECDEMTWTTGSMRSRCNA